MKIKRKIPPFGKMLAERQKFSNIPFLTVICTGHDDWNSAKRWNASGDNVALVLPAELQPEDCNWPVSRCTCVIEWNQGPDSNLIIRLARCLLVAGAETVVVWPRFVDHKSPAVAYDESKEIGHRWVQCREVIRVYRRPTTGGSHVSA